MKHSIQTLTGIPAVACRVDSMEPLYDVLWAGRFLAIWVTPQWCHGQRRQID